MIHINALGQCRLCGHTITRPIRAKLIDEECLSPCECPVCHDGPTVHFEKLAVHHKRSLSKRRLLLVLLLSFIGLFIALGFIYVELKLHKEYPAENVSAAIKEVSSMDSAHILRVLQEEAKVNEKRLSKILSASPYTIRRITTGVTKPTACMDSCIRNLLIQWILLDRSKLLFLIQFRNGTDIWYPYPNPLHEITESSPVRPCGIVYQFKDFQSIGIIVLQGFQRARLKMFVGRIVIPAFFSFTPGQGIKAAIKKNLLICQFISLLQSDTPSTALSPPCSTDLFCPNAWWLPS